MLLSYAYRAIQNLVAREERPNLGEITGCEKGLSERILTASDG